MYISIDVGGTNTRVAGIAELDSPVFVTDPIRRPNSHNYADDLRFMINAALQIADGRPIAAVGIGTPGTPNADYTEIAADAPNFSSWLNRPLVAPLSQELSCPVYYDNDAIAAALGEAYYGPTKEDFDYVIWGTGIGGADVRHADTGGRITVSKKPWAATFEAWEADCGGGMLKRHGKDPRTMNDTEWETVAEHFGRHLGLYVERHHPQAIVFGGGLAVRRTQLLLGLADVAGVPLAVTNFGSDSGLMGGFGLIQHANDR